MKSHLSFHKQKIRSLLLESIHPAAEQNLRAAGCWRVDTRKGAYSEEQLLGSVPSVHILGIRSKTSVNERVLSAAPNLLAVGCFCIGTDKVDLEAATRCGVAVFNAPFSNTRSGIGYLITDVERSLSSGVKKKIDALDTTIRTRILS